MIEESMGSLVIKNLSMVFFSGFLAFVLFSKLRQEQYDCKKYYFLTLFAVPAANTIVAIFRTSEIFAWNILYSGPFSVLHSLRDLPLICYESFLSYFMYIWSALLLRAFLKKPLLEWIALLVSVFLLLVTDSFVSFLGIRDPFFDYTPTAAALWIGMYLVLTLGEKKKQQCVVAL